MLDGNNIEMLYFPYYLRCCFWYYPDTHSPDLLFLRVPLGHLGFLVVVLRVCAGSHSPVFLFLRVPLGHRDDLRTSASNTGTFARAFFVTCFVFAGYNPDGVNLEIVARRYLSHPVYVLNWPSVFDINCNV